MLAISLLAQFHWLPRGRAGWIIIFAAGVVTIAALRLASLPPQWFDASRSGFGLVGWFLAGALVSASGEARTFGRPLFLGLGLSLLAVNVAAFIAQRL